MESSSHRKYRQDPLISCFVPSCKNTALMSPNKHFFPVPRKTRSEWCAAVKKGNVPKSAVYICEDHIDLEKDLSNYNNWRMGVRGRLKDRVPDMKNIGVAELQESVSELLPTAVTINENKGVLTPGCHDQAGDESWREERSCCHDVPATSIRVASWGLNPLLAQWTCDDGDVTPPRLIPEDSRSVTPITDPEDEERETEVTIEFDDEKDYKIVIQDPLSQSSALDSFKQLHFHQPGATQTQLYVEPSTSSEVVVKEEIDEEILDYKAMYFKLLEEITALKNQQLCQENQNQALIETNKNIAKELENLVKRNQKYKDDIHLASENQRLIDKNKSLAENVQYLTEKIQELTEKNNEQCTIERVDIINDYKKEIEDLNEKIRNLTEENKSLTERNKTFAESIRKYSEESRRFKMKNTLQRKFIQRLKNNFNNRLETKSRLLKALRHNLMMLKADNARLQRPRVAVVS